MLKQHLIILVIASVFLFGLLAWLLLRERESGVQEEVQITEVEHTPVERMPQAASPAPGRTAAVESIPAFTPKGDSSIEGTITDSTALPLHGAEVMLRGWLPPQAPSLLNLIVSPLPRPGKAIAVAVTNGSGTYSFHGLKRGNFIITAKAEGYAQNGLEVVQLEELETRTGADLRLYPAERIIGRVIDEYGRGIERAEISFFRTGNPLIIGAPDWSDFDSVFSDEQGRFEARHLLSGKYDLTANARGYIPAEPRNVSTAQEEITITLAEGYTIQGRVVDERENPVGGAEVQFIQKTPTGAHGLSLPKPVLERSAVANRYGRFALADLSQANLSDKPYIAVMAMGYEVAVWPAPERWADVTGEVMIVLRAGAMVKGRVRGASGRALAGAEVEVLRSYAKGGRTTGYSERPWRGFSSNRNGRFEVFGLPQGTVDLRISAEGYSPQILSGVQCPSSSLEVTLNAGGTVFGKVVQQDNAAIGVEGAKVTAMSVGASRLEVHVALSRGGGEFAFYGLPEGDYEMRASQLSIPGGEKTVVSVGSGEVVQGVQLSIRVTGRISGRVLARDGGQAIAGAEISARSERGRRRVETNGGGHYFLEGLWEGTWEISVRAKGYSPILFGTREARTLELAKGRNVENVDLHMYRGGNVSGRVVDYDGKPVSHTLVFIASPPVDVAGKADNGEGEMRPLPSVSSITDDEGRFSLENVSADIDFEVVVDNRRYPKYRSDVMRVSEGQSIQTDDLRLERSGTLNGVLVNQKGEPLQGRLKCRNADTRSKKDGSFRMVRVPIGIRTLRAQAEGYKSKSIAVTVQLESEFLEVMLDAEAQD